MSVDGRTARRHRNRDLVLDAAIDLFGEGHAPPTPAQVAGRSGVSLRSVYRYFSDHDELVVAAVGRFVERNERLFILDVPFDAPLGDRIERFVDSRLRLYDAVAPVAMMATRRSAEVPVFAAQLTLRRRMFTRQCADLFAAEFAALGDGVAEAVDALTQFGALEHLREHRGLSRRRTREALIEALRRLLGD